MRSSDWSSDVCSSDLYMPLRGVQALNDGGEGRQVHVYSQRPQGGEQAHQDQPARYDGQGALYRRHLKGALRFGRSVGMGRIRIRVLSAAILACLDKSL